MENIAICLTAGCQSENAVGMNKNGKGKSKKGYTPEKMLEFKNKLEKLDIECEYYRFDRVLENPEKSEEAALLIIRNPIEKLIGCTAEELLKEQLTYEWDKKYWDVRRQKVLNKLARHNVCYGDKPETADYENKRGTIIAYDSVPLLKKWREMLGTIFGDMAKDLEVEGNKYHNVKKCGIGEHGDEERIKVIALSLGASRPISWRWFHRCKPISERQTFILNKGDMYIMSEKTTGHDWKKQVIRTLRHCAGEKYIK